MSTIELKDVELSLQSAVKRLVLAKENRFWAAIDPFLYPGYPGAADDALELANKLRPQWESEAKRAVMGKFNSLISE